MNSLTERLKSAIERLDSSRDSHEWNLAIDAWRDCSERYGQESAPALGCLMALVRLAYGSKRIGVSFGSFAFCSVDAPWGRLSEAGNEIWAIVGALEGAPDAER